MTSMFSSPVYEQITVTMSGKRAKHWLLTVPCNTPNAKFWENPVTMMHIEYLVGQEEVSKKTAYNHYQLYMVLKESKRIKWIHDHIHATCHCEVKRGSVAEAIDYCTKEDTRKPNGVRIELGVRPKEQSGKAVNCRNIQEINPDTCREKDDTKKDAQTIILRLKEEYIPLEAIPVDVLLLPGFINTWRAFIKDMVGPMRPNLKIVTLIGPPGCGKSYAIAEHFPKAGRVMYGNNGTWFCNAKSRVMVFEEFMGQIPLQNMLKYLDPYPMSLEVKGGTEPAFYDLVIITSNTPVKDWYTTADEFKDKPGDPTAATTAKKRRVDALAALHDRLGLNPLSRTCGEIRQYALQPENLMPIKDQIAAIREEIMAFLGRIKVEMESKPCPQWTDISLKTVEDTDVMEVLPSAQDPNAELSPIDELQHPHKTADGLTAEERDLADYMDELKKQAEAKDMAEDISDDDSDFETQQDDVIYQKTSVPAATAAAAAPKRIVVKTETNEEDEFFSNPEIHESEPRVIAMGGTIIGSQMPTPKSDN